MWLDGHKHGQHIAHDPAKHPPLANVLLSIAQKMGVETGKFAVRRIWPSHHCGNRRLSRAGR